MSLKWHHLLFPHRCLFCGSPVTASERICEMCMEALPIIGAPVCFFCGISKADCACREKRHFYDAIIAPFYYEGAVAKGIRLMKFAGRTENAEYFGEAISVCASHYYSEIAFDCVCFVPESEDVLKERGYNQSRLLAESVSRYLNVPCGELLKKLYTTKPQRTLSAAERQGNVLGVFETNPEEITAGKKILLIDDIKTTGATLDECAKSLLIAGADRVFCAVAAVSPMRASQNEETAEETLTAK